MNVVKIVKEKWRIILLGIISIIILGVVGALIFIYTSFDRAIPVLAYHDVLKEPKADTDISIEKFEKQIKYLYDNGYKSLSLDEFYDWKNGKDIKGKKVVITFDDGRESFYTVAAPILKKYNMKATLFAVGSYLNTSGFLTDDQINAMKEEYPDLDVEAHSYALHYEDGARCGDYNIYNEDIKKNIDRNFKYYAYPFGITNDSYQDALEDNEYKLAFLYSPGKWTDREQDNYTLTRVPVYNSTSFFKFKLKVLLNIK